MHDTSIGEERDVNEAAYLLKEALEIEEAICQVAVSPSVLSLQLDLNHE